MSFFVVKLPLEVNDYVYKILDARFEVARVLWQA